MKFLISFTYLVPTLFQKFRNQSHEVVLIESFIQGKLITSKFEFCFFINPVLSFMVSSFFSQRKSLNLMDKNFLMRIVSVVSSALFFLNFTLFWYNIYFFMLILKTAILRISHVPFFTNFSLLIFNIFISCIS